MHYLSAPAASASTSLASNSSVPPPVSAASRQAPSSAAKSPSAAPSAIGAPQLSPAPAVSTQPARLYVATYSTVPVYELTVRGIAVMRRRADGYLNATQILKVAGVEKTRRTKILDREIIMGEHEKVQGGYGRYQGTWIPLHRAKKLCATYGVASLLKPLLEFDPADEGTLTQAPKGRRINPNAPSQQRMFANLPQWPPEWPPPGPVPPAFRRLATPYPAPPPTFVPPHNGFGVKLGQSPRFLALRSPEGQAVPKQVRIDSAGSGDESLPHDQKVPTHSAVPTYRPSAEETAEAADLLSRFEPVRDLNMLGPDDGLLQAAALTPSDPTAINVLRTGKSARIILGPPENLARDTSARFADRPQAFRTTGADESQERALKEVLTSLFLKTGPENEFTGSGTPLSQLQTLLKKMASALSRASGNGAPMPAVSVNIMLDDHGHAPLHWAAALGNLSLVRMLIALPPEQGGANVQAGNHAGETALHRAVLVANGYEADTFPELLNLLRESIFTRDYKRRTVLHHIALVAALRGRVPSARYYLSTLLDMLFPKGPSAGRAEGGTIPPQAAQALLDAQDGDGETALGIVARLYNASMVRLLLDCGARKDMPNYLGIRPVDWGIGPLASAKPDEEAASAAKDVVASLARPPEPPLPKSEDVLEGMCPSLPASAAHHSIRGTDGWTDVRGALAEMAELHRAEMESKNAAVAEAQSALQRATRDLAAQRREVAAAQQTDALIDEARQTVTHIDRVIAELKALAPTVDETAATELIALDSQRLVAGQEWDKFLQPLLSPDVHLHDNEEELVRLRWLAHSLEHQSRLWATRQAEVTLRGQQREAKCRRVVAMCCNVTEDRVEDILDDLLVAVESDGPAMDLARVAEFMSVVKSGQGGDVADTKSNTHAKPKPKPKPAP